MKPTLLLPIFCLTLLGSCKKPNYQEDAYEALQGKKDEKAADFFLAALASKHKTSDDFRDLALGRCQALAHFKPEDALKTFETLVNDQQIIIDSPDFEFIISELMQAGAYEQAATITLMGLSAYPESTRMPEFMTKLQQLAKEPANSGLSSTLQGSGYGGGE